MATYLVIRNGEASKSYKCNTTHTSQPYIRVNEKNYLDLNSETTTGLQLRYSQKTGSSYSTYNTTSLEETEELVSKISGYQNNDVYTTSAYSEIEKLSNTITTTSRSVVTFRNRIYIPVQSQSTTVTTTRSSQYTETTGYSGRSTNNTTTYTTTGYSGVHWWSEDRRSTTGYSAYSTGRQTTGTGYRSTTSSNRVTYGLWHLTGTRSNTSYTTYGATKSSSKSSTHGVTWDSSYWASRSGQYEIISEAPDYSNYTIIGYVSWREGTFRTTYCVSSGTSSEYATSRYATSDYEPFYGDFTATATGYKTTSNYWTSPSYPSNANGVTALTAGYTTRLSQYTSSTAASTFSNTTALTSSGTKTSSSLRTSTNRGDLVSITDLTITSTRTSLTNRTSSTDL